MNQCPQCRFDFRLGALNKISPFEYIINPQEELVIERDPLFQERQKTHGSFEQNASISQAIKHIYHSKGRYPAENMAHCEALDMIALKLSRILSGQANFKDHWDDIAGYAKLGAEACE